MGGRDESFDAIVIGAGLGGLTAAATLTAAGRRVAVVEQHSKVGGYATNFRRRCFTFEVSLHNMGPLHEHKALAQALKGAGVRDEELGYVGFSQPARFVFPDYDLSIGVSLATLSQSLAARFPDEASGIESLFALVRRIRQEYEGLSTGCACLGESMRARPLLALEYGELTRFAEETAEQLIAQHVSDERLRSIVASLWWYCGLPPKTLEATRYAIVLSLFGDSSGGALRGTSQRLADLLAKKVRLGGGEIIVGCRARQVMVSGGRVTGVVSGGSRGVLYAPTVVANVNPHDLFEGMLDETISVKGMRKYRRRLADAAVSLSATQVYLGLSRDPRELGMDTHSVSLFETYDHEQCYRDTLQGNHGRTVCSLTNYTAFDSSLAPPGKAVMNIVALDHIGHWQGLSRSAYVNKKAEVARELIGRAERVVPGLSSHVEVQEVGTPLTMRRYTANRDGAIYGFAHSPQLSVSEGTWNRTPIHGLYLAGAYTYPGAGYASAAASGYRAAMEAMGRQDTP